MTFTETQREAKRAGISWKRGTEERWRVCVYERVTGVCVHVCVWDSGRQINRGNEGQKRKVRLKCAATRVRVFKSLD